MPLKTIKKVLDSPQKKTSKKDFTTGKKYQTTGRFPQIMLDPSKKIWTKEKKIEQRKNKMV